MFNDIVYTGIPKIEKFFFLNWSSLKWEIKAGAGRLSLTWGLHGPILQDGSIIGMRLWVSHRQQSLYQQGDTCQGGPSG
jgi:hypothetical protein